MKNTRYLFITTFALKTTLDRILPVLIDYSSWPIWWKGLQGIRVQNTSDPKHPQIHCWVGFPIYQLHFTLIPTSLSKDKTITMDALGDLQGSGTFSFTENADQTDITFTWSVETTKLWMNLVAAFAKPIFVHEHNLVMTWFAKGLAKHLQTDLIFINHLQKS